MNVVSTDTLLCSAERIWASLMHNAIERNKGKVLVYLVTSCKKTLIKRYPFMLQCTIVEQIDSSANLIPQIINLSKNGQTTVFLDSVDIISLNSSIDQVIALLEGISR